LGSCRGVAHAGSAARIAGRGGGTTLPGSAVYGAFAAKVIIVRLRRFPKWVLPTAGALLFATLVAVWYTSALWFFRTVDVGV
jgi:hypothetical protein